MRLFFLKLISTISIITLSLSAHASETNDNPFYVGLAAGYGSTNWDGMKALDQTSESSTPITAKSTGFEWGGFVGWQPIKNLALEFRYQKFTDSLLTFSSNSIYPKPPMPESLQFTSQTWAYSLVAKFIVPFGETGIAAFANVGPVYTRRSDPFANSSQTSAYPAGKNSKLGIMFGGGLNYDVTNHIRTTFEFSYGSGYGESSQYPVYTYIPFIYAVEFKLAYRFSLTDLFTHKKI